MLATIWAVGFFTTLFIFMSFILVWQGIKLRKWSEEFIDGEQGSSTDDSLPHLFKYKINMDPVDPWQFLVDCGGGFILSFVSSAAWPVSLPFLGFLIWINKQRNLALVAKRLAEDPETA